MTKPEEHASLMKASQARQARDVLVLLRASDTQQLHRQTRLGWACTGVPALTDV